MRQLINSLLRTLAVLIVPLAIGVSGQVSAVSVFQACDQNVAGQTHVCNGYKTSGNPIIRLISDVIDILAVVIGFAAVVMIIIAGFTFVTGGNDPQSVARARTSIIYALIGIIIVAASQGIVLFVLDKL